jgi:pimeloyl-ACP methyl ester carboxylesterase
MPASARAAIRFLAGLLLVVHVSGCARVRVWELRPGSLNHAVRELLGEADSDGPKVPGPDGVPGKTPPLLPPSLIRAEACCDEARRRETRSGDEALQLYLESLACAWATLVAPVANHGEGSADPPRDQARSIYNRALGGFLRLAGGRAFRLDDSWCAALSRRGLSVALRRDGAVWPPDRFDEFRFAGDFTITGMDHHHGSDGLGVPLIASRRPGREELDRRQGEERFYPFWEVHAVTAVLRFEQPAAGASRAVLELHDPLRFDRVAIGGREVALAADLTTATAYHFAHSRLKWYEQVSMFTPGNLARESGLYLLRPYEPGKIPVVMVHGLWSSPMAWARVVDELRGDPELRARYQFWMYMYPTGNPFLLSAADFRRALGDVRQAVDPQCKDRAFDQMVLVGHSMGGLLSKLMITESDNEIWRVYSEQPFERLAVGPEHRALLSRVMFFHPTPCVRRVVYIATPHRGAKLGGSLVGRIGDRLIKLPSPLQTTYQAMLRANGPEFFTAGFREGLPSSVDELAPDNPLLTAMGRLPVAPGVVCHSVIGRWGIGPLETSSDGVVPYTSSHTDVAASEFVVRSLHECQDDPRTIQELRRILLLHEAQSVRQVSRREDDLK